MLDKYSMNNRIVDCNKNSANILPIVAWQLDNRRDISTDEIRLSVDKIQLEKSSFKYFSSRTGNNKKAMKEEIIEIVNARGKLHNPYTDTGGILSGRVEKIGDDYINTNNLTEGDEVVVLVTISMIPLYIEKIIDIDFGIQTLDVEGYCILTKDYALIKKPDHIGLIPLMLVMEESACPSRVYDLAKNNKTFFIIGSSPMISYLYACCIREAVGKNGLIIGLICDLYINTDLEILLNKIFDKIYFQNSVNLMEYTNLILNDNQKLFDLSINCSVETQAEVINILATRAKGTIFFSNMIYSSSITALLTEALKKDINIFGCVGYAENYKSFNLGILNKYADDIEKIAKTYSSQKSSNKQIYGARKSNDRVMGNKETYSHDTDDIVLYDFVYESPVMEKLVKEISKAAKFDSPVLILGESGTGKEKIAEILHNNSKRMMGPCIKVNCASIPANLLESEFFGYERGAFTGANSTGKAGYFELADKGTLFLDEISELPYEQQSKFLRVLQEKRYYRIGGVQPINSDFRIIAASNNDLKSMVEGGAFREDLYYRIAVLVLVIPALRNRKADIIPLAKYLLNKYSKMYNYRKEFNDDAFDIFLNYRWPGNIREMENIIQRVIVNCENDEINGDAIVREINRDKLPKGGEQSLGGGTLRYGDFITAQEKEFIKSALLKYKTTRKAAAALGITQSQFMRMKKKYNL